MIMMCKKHKSNELTPMDVSNVLGKNYRTILRWTKDGVFGNSRKCKYCGSYLIQTADVDAYIESLKL